MGHGDQFPFQLDDLNQPKAQPLDYPTVTTRAEAPCPGKVDNTVVLLRGRQVLDGLRKLHNVGSCKIHIACYDKSGTFIGTYHLAPGERINFLSFPSNTEEVRLGCHKACTGTAILEYETPYIA